MVLCLSFDSTKYQRDRQNTSQGQENSTTYPCLGFFMNKRVFNLTSTISSALLRVCLLNSFKIRNCRRTGGGGKKKLRVTFWQLIQSYYQCAGQPTLVNYQCHPNPDEENNRGSGHGRTQIWMQRRFESCSRDVKSNALVSIERWSIPVQSSVASSQGDIFFQSVSNPSLLPANTPQSHQWSSCLNTA